MALLASEIDDFKTALEETKWTPEMSKLIEALQEKKSQAADLARIPLYECLDQHFEMPTSDISDFMRTCLKDNRYPGHQLLIALTLYLENTPS